MEFPQPPAREPNSQLRETAPNREQRRAQTRELEDWLEEAVTEIASLRQELEAARERNLIANERADNAQADAARARLLALGEAADAISEKMVEARSFGVEERELTAMGWALDAVRALTERWPPSPRARASGREG